MDKKFWIFLVLLVLDLIVQDPLPWLDEILLAAATAYFGTRKPQLPKGE